MVLKVLTANVGWSTATDGFAAGKEAAIQAVRGLSDVSLAVVYGSVDYDQAALLRGVQAVVGQAPLIGSTSFTGVLTPGGFISGAHGFCTVMALSDADMHVAVAGMAKAGDARATGRQVAGQALARLGAGRTPRYFYMVAPPGEEELYLKGIEDVIGRVPFFGGSAADNTMEGRMRHYANGQVLDSGVAVAFFDTVKPFGHCYTGAYRFGGHSGIITKVADKRQLREIDGQPALQVYAGWRGLSVEQLKGANLMAATIHAPLGILDSEGDLTWIRHPVAGGDDLSMAVGNDLVENTAVCLMEATTDELIHAVAAAVEQARQDLGAEPGALFIVHCGGRAAGIGDRMGEVISGVKAVSGDVPFVGALTFGEYGYGEWTRNGCGGLMLSVFMLAK